MSSLIFDQRVIATGSVSVVDGGHMVSTDTGDVLYPAIVCPGAYVVDAEPPHTAASGAYWVYTDGKFVEVKPAPITTPETATVPSSITRAQAKLALLGAGLLDQVQPAIDAIADPTQRAATQIEWDDRLTFERSNATLIALASSLGLDDKALDDLFAKALTL